MKKIIPHLWFDKEAKEATEFYVSAFPNSKIKNHSVIKGTPSGDCDILSFDLAGQPFMSISAGPYFKINPSVSFMVNFDPSKDPQAKENLSILWEKLSSGGTALMPLQEYPFSKWYGWIQDKYGVSWQLILTDPTGDERPTIIPAVMFVGEMSGKAEEARDFYTSVFKDSEKGIIAKYGEGQAPNKPEDVMFSDFRLLGTWFVAMDSGLTHDFRLNEGVSFIVNCENQEEIDYYWEKLSAVPEAEQCGWLKDKYGLSWQITPQRMNEMMDTGTPEQKKRVTEAFLKMKKFDIATLEEAFQG